MALFERISRVSLEGFIHRRGIDRRELLCDYGQNADAEKKKSSTEPSAVYLFFRFKYILRLRNPRWGIFFTQKRGAKERQGTAVMKIIFS